MSARLPKKSVSPVSGASFAGNVLRVSLSKRIAGLRVVVVTHALVTETHKYTILLTRPKRANNSSFLGRVTASQLRFVDSGKS